MYENAKVTKTVCGVDNVSHPVFSPMYQCSHVDSHVSLATLYSEVTTLTMAVYRPLATRWT